jgi:hypothetical protein
MALAAGSTPFATYYVSQPGDLTVTTPLLAARTYYYVVRARDADGTSDDNTVELSADPCDE